MFAMVADGAGEMIGIKAPEGAGVGQATPILTKVE